MKKLTWFFQITFILTLGCQSDQPLEQTVPSLKDAYQNIFLIGTVLNSNQLSGNDSNSMALVKKHFNSITAENDLKWEKVHPKPDVFNFDVADKFVTFGQKNNLFIIGHTLVWHNQIPGWVFEGENGQSADHETLLARMREHIFEVAGRYKGKINGWDVVNEAFDNQGALRRSKWLEIIGPEYIETAFQWAHEADPEAELYYNDFNMWYPGKREAVVKLIHHLRIKNIPIHGIGLQGHWGLDYPPMDELEASLKAYAETGLKVMITELDIDLLPQPEAYSGAEITKRYERQEFLDPFKYGLPDSMQEKLSKRYHELFNLLIKYRAAISRVTFWGVHDGVSWKNNWPVHGRTSYPLLFDRQYRPKPAFYELINLVAGD